MGLLLAGCSTIGAVEPSPFEGRDWVPLRQIGGGHAGHIRAAKATGCRLPSASEAEVAWLYGLKMRSGFGVHALLALTARRRSFGGQIAVHQALHEGPLAQRQSYDQDP